MDLKDLLPDEYFPTTLSNAIPAIGPRSFHRPRKDNLATSIDTPISHRITDKSLLASLHRDTSIKIRQPSPSGTTSGSRTSKQSKPASFSARQTPKKLHLYPPQEPPTFPKFDVPPHRRKTPKPELSELTEDFMEDPKENVPDNIEECCVIKSDLKKLRTYQVDEDQYEEALKTHQFIAIIDSKIFELDQYDTTLSDLRHSVTKHQEIEQVVATYLAEWDKTYEEFIETMQSELEKIEEENRVELEKFDESIPKGLSTEFRKASQRLLNLRSAEKRLAYSNQLPFALQLKQRADMIERQEAEQQYIKQSKIIEARRERLIKAQNNRIKTFLDHIKSTRNVMIQTRNKTVGGYLKRLNYLDKDIDEIAQRTNIDVDAMCSSSIDQDRADFVKQEEMASPIPLFQPGTAFAISRKKIREAEEMERSQQSQQSQLSQKSSHYSRSRHSRSQTQSNISESQRNRSSQQGDNQSEQDRPLEQIFGDNANALNADQNEEDQNENHNEEENINENNNEEENENENNGEEENENEEKEGNGEEENENEDGGEDEGNGEEDANDDESQNSQTQPVSSNPRRKINANNTIH